MEKMNLDQMKKGKYRKREKSATEKKNIEYFLHRLYRMNIETVFLSLKQAFNAKT